MVLVHLTEITTGGSRGGGVPGAILSFSHIFSPKSAPVGGLRLPSTGRRPVWEILDPALLTKVFEDAIVDAFAIF